jgi:hypothetical protein
MVDAGGIAAFDTGWSLFPASRRIPAVKRFKQRRNTVL